jgi:AraC family transcriptional regulator
MPHSSPPPQWSLPLDQPPRVIYTGVGRHGQREKELRYRFRDQWCFHLYRYRGRLELSGRIYEFDDGTVSLIPPDTPFRHIWLRAGSTHFFSLFQHPVGPGVSFPLLQAQGPQGAALFTELTESATWYAADPARTSARLWDVLWRLARGAPAGEAAPADDTRHPALRAVEATIEAKLSEGLRLAKLARSAGVTPNHLNRLFLRAHGLNARSYLQARRWERAAYLLRHTTMPVKAVAVEAGYPDPGHFNKFVRARAGCAPRAFRARDGEG